MAEASRDPTSHSYFSQRLRLHYVDWGNEDAPPMLLVHGGRDHCRNWDWVAHAFRDEYHVIAPDLRGHGDSQWLIGANYSIVDYVYDVAQLIEQKKLYPITIIGHSLGGSISLSYAGTYSERIDRVVAIEGLGPSPKIIEERASLTPTERMREWIETVRELAGRFPHRYRSVEEAEERMQAANPHLSPDQAHHLSIHGTTQNEDGSYSWKFDNYVRAFSPFAFNADEAHALWRRIECPVLLIRGAESWASDPQKDGRAKFFRNAQSVNVDGAGHWVHHDQFDDFLRLVRKFLTE